MALPVEPIDDQNVPPTRLQLAVMVWVSVVPTLMLANLFLGELLSTLQPALRTAVLATVAVPVVIYVVMPQLERLRVRIVNRGSNKQRKAMKPPAANTSA
ncbi:hypothetical protein AS031_18335 [Pseudarthrobacter enclensis]|uniref:Uncharacterized protein n=2 Tax=Pseudarthrobacter enclensis TaxID=993070 RepID=A0A0V8I6S9_9MICC|nr:hypothetical protein AS031_18335 [Pseudarthrobacter enclensis]